MGKFLRSSTSRSGNPNESDPQGEQHSQVSRAFLERIIQDLHSFVQGWTAQLVFNRDEAGIADWEDRETKKVIVPAAMLGQTMHYGVSRNVKHILVIACVSAAGGPLLQDIITSQNSPTLHDHLKKQGVRFGRDFALKFNQKPYFNAGIFLDYVRTIFLPYVETFHGLTVFPQELAFLLMESGSKGRGLETALWESSEWAFFWTKPCHASRRWLRAMATKTKKTMPMEVGGGPPGRDADVNWE
jgi:hypothetical protein